MPNAFYLLRSVPGIGKILALVHSLRDPRHRPLPTGAGVRLLLPSGQVRQRVGRKATMALPAKRSATFI